MSGLLGKVLGRIVVLGGTSSAVLMCLVVGPAKAHDGRYWDRGYYERPVVIRPRYYYPPPPVYYVPPPPVYYAPPPPVYYYPPPPRYYGPPRVSFGVVF